MITRLTAYVFGNAIATMLVVTVFSLCSCTRCAPVQKVTTHAHKEKADTAVPNLAPESQQSGEAEPSQAHDGTTVADSRAVKKAVESFSAGLAVNHPLRKSVVYWSTSDWLRMREELRDPSDQLKSAFLACVSEAFHSVDPLSATNAFSSIVSNLLELAGATHDKAFANAIISQSSSIEQKCCNYARAYDLARSVIDRAALGEPCDPYILNSCKSKATITSAQQGLYEKAERELHEWQAASASSSDREPFMMALAEANMYLCLKGDGKMLSNKARTKQGYDVLKKMSEATYMSESQKIMVQHMMRDIEKYYPYVLSP